MSSEIEIDLKQYLLYILHFIKKQMILILLFFIISIVSFAVYFYITPEKYSSKITMFSRSFQFTIVEKMMSPVIENLSSGSHEQVNKLLQANLENVKDLQEIEISEVRLEKNEKITSVFEIEISTLNPNYFRQLDSIIPNYLNNLKIVKEKTQTLKKSLSKSLKQIEVQKQNLITTQEKVNDILINSKDDKTVFSNLDLGFIYNQMVLMDLSLVKMEEEYLDVEEFKVITDFGSIRKRSISHYLKLGGLFGIILNMIYFLYFVMMNPNFVRKKSN